MKHQLMLKATGLALAMALGVAAAPSFAADDTSSDTYSNPGTMNQDNELQPQTPPDTAAPPSAVDESGMQTTQPRGARGPIRADEMNSAGGYRGTGYTGSDRGMMGFYDWQHQNTNSP